MCRGADAGGAGPVRAQYGSDASDTVHRCHQLHGHPHRRSGCRCAHLASEAPGALSLLRDGRTRRAWEGARALCCDSLKLYLIFLFIIFMISCVALLDVQGACGASCRLVLVMSCTRAFRLPAPLDWTRGRLSRQCCSVGARVFVSGQHRRGIQARPSLWRHRRRGVVAGVPGAYGLRGFGGEGYLLRVDGGWPCAQEFQAHHGTQLRAARAVTAAELLVSSCRTCGSSCGAWTAAQSGSMPGGHAHTAGLQLQMCPEIPPLCACGGGYGRAAIRVRAISRMKI